MAPNQENESPEPNQAQDGSADAAQEEMPEPLRKCKLCGGPNHHACGCEAKQIREAQETGLTEREAKALQESEQQTATEPQPAPGPQPALDWFSQKLTDEEREMANRLYDNFENISVNLMDIVNLLKLISQESMASRALLQKMEAKMNNGKDTNQN